MKNDKWAVSEKEYPDKLYPNFVSGETRTQMFPTRKILSICDHLALLCLKLSYASQNVSLNIWESADLRREAAHLRWEAADLMSRTNFTHSCL